MFETPLDEDISDRVRSWFPHTQTGHIYLNHAAISPLSIHVKEAIDSFIRERQSGPIDNLEQSIQLSEETRKLAAEYLNAESTSTISFLGNTSEGISAIAEGLRLEAGDEVLLNSMEFPTNVQPYRALLPRGIKTAVIETPRNEITASMIEKQITSKTKVVSISAVQFLSGYRADLEAIGKLCEERGVWFVVDAIQCLGAFPIDVQACRISALASGSHKWLMSPMGTGILYTAPALAAELQPSKTGWLSVEEPWDLFRYDQDWLPYSQHMETGTPNMIGLVGLGASLKMFKEAGHDRISRAVLNLSGYLTRRLERVKGVNLISPTDDVYRAGIVSFTIDGVKDTQALTEDLKKKRITISAREGVLRIAPHFYNTSEELDTTLNTMPL